MKSHAPLPARSPADEGLPNWVCGSKLYFERSKTILEDLQATEAELGSLGSAHVARYESLLRASPRGISSRPRSHSFGVAVLKFLSIHPSRIVVTASRAFQSLPLKVVLKLLAAQAAISLENVRLYGELQERDAKIRRLVDSNIIGIFTWRADGRIMEANEAFLRIVQHDRDDVTSGRLSWRDLTPAEWRDADDRRAAEVKALGVAQPYEKEYFRKGGGRVPVLVGGAAFEKGAEEGVTFVVDLSDRKRAEMEVRESERRYHEVEMALARANRIATLGHMSASIAHEINQPVAATVTNAQAALRFLEAQQPNIDEARQALRRIARLGNRVAEVITRVRALVRNLPARKEQVDINEAIREVISLSQGELVKNGVSAKASFADDLPQLQADRVQLQQLILNLMMNAIEALNSRPEGSRELRISTVESRTREILVSVEDSGPGLDLTHPERAFDTFYSTKPEGLGIGLSICRSIVEAHGGHLWAAASELGGAAFTFTLPVQPGRQLCRR